MPTDDVDCDAGPRGLLRGASNVYFPITISALSIPPWTNPVQEKLNKVWSLIEGKSDAELRQVHELLFPAFHWELFLDAVERRRGLAQASNQSLKREEYQAIAAGTNTGDREFEVALVQPPANVAGIDSVSRLDRLREVVALKAFTRIDYPDRDSSVAVNEAPLSSSPTDWRPAIENRGEGIFLRFDVSRLTTWEKEAGPVTFANAINKATGQWRAARGLDAGTPIKARFVYIHSISHLLLRVLSLESGYSSSSLRERIYVDDAMAGILIYTASSDSDGSLGGLVAQSRPDRLSGLLDLALASSSICSSDPLCSERFPRGGHMSGAACHACLLVSETSCEFGNRYLDRGTVVDFEGQKSRSFVPWLQNI